MGVLPHPTLTPYHPSLSLNHSDLYIIISEFLFQAVTEVPKVIDVTTSSALLEFKQANGTTHNYQLEYAQITNSTTEKYVKGAKINAVHGQSTYWITQRGLIPGRHYQLRIIPNIHINTTDYGGIPSSAVQVNILVPGKKLQSLNSKLFYYQCAHQSL